jgi:hypothetical protein
MKLVPVLASLGLVAGSLLVGSTTAAEARGCSAQTLGKHRYTVGAASHHWTIRQHDVEENYSGEPAQISFHVESGRRVTDSVSVGTEVSGSIKAAIFGSLETKVSANLGHVGEVSLFQSVTRTYSLRSGDVYHFAGGSGFWRARAVVYRCSRAGSTGQNYYWDRVGAGPVIGYMGRTRTVVGCEKSTDPGTLARAIKIRYC